ncbi:MAG: PAS domain-containing sensor histidine kinase [Hyphomicrobiales bacterium]
MTFVSIYFIKNPDYGISSILFVLVLLFLIIELIRYVEQTNRKLSKFLESIHYSDFSIRFREQQHLGETFKDLNYEFNQVIEKFRKYRAEIEEHYNYLQTIVQHVSIGIIVFKDNGKVEIINNEVKKLLKINSLYNINQLTDYHDNLSEKILSLKGGDKILIKIIIDNELYQLSVHAAEFRMRGDDMTLISIQNIHNELEQKEVESWQKLIRVLTHEISNSMTPISSLASTVKDVILEEDDNGKVALSDIDNDDIETIDLAMQTIENRSEGLLNFVNVYRNLTRIPKPNFRYFRVKDLFTDIESLYSNVFSEKGIKFIARCFPDDLMLTADPDLLQQALINLVKNAMEAIGSQENPTINITASINMDNRIIIEVKDNGQGIKPDILDKIFMPFFTSKKSGSGVGLSLSRQILQMHKGNINVKSIPEQGTIFTLII